MHSHTFPEILLQPPVSRRKQLHNRRQLLIWSISPTLTKKVVFFHYLLLNNKTLKVFTAYCRVLIFNGRSYTLLDFFSAWSSQPIVHHLELQNSSFSKEPLQLRASLRAKDVKQFKCQWNQEDTRLRYVRKKGQENGDLHWDQELFLCSKK